MNVLERDVNNVVPIPTPYTLSHLEWVGISTSLSNSEMKVLLYLRTLDPTSSQWMNLRIETIATDLNIHKSTVSRALKTLEARQFIDLEISAVRVRLLNCEDELRPRNKVAPTQQSCAHATELHPRNEVAPTQQSCAHATELRPRNNPEPLITEGSEASPQIHSPKPTREISLLNKSDQISLSEEESEEEILAFIESQNPDAKKPRAYARACWKKDPKLWLFNYRQWRDSGGESVLPPPAAPTAPIPRPPIASIDQVKSVNLKVCQELFQREDFLTLAVKLRDLLRDGYRDLVEWLCNEHREWGFRLEGDRVVPCRT